MQHAVIVKDERGARFELHPVLSLWVGEDFVPFAQGVIERFDLVSVDAEYGAVVVVVSHQHQFSRRFVVLQDRVAAVEQGTDHCVFVSGRVGTDADATKRFVGVRVDVFEHGSC